MLEMVFCGNCGREIKTPVKFCPQCGTPLAIETTTTPPPPPAASSPKPTLKDKSHLFSTSTVSGSELFATYRTGYIINENSWDWGSGEILDEKGRKIGNMTRKILSLRSEIRLTELDGTVAASINKKIVAIKPTYEIKDASENFIGKIEKALLSFRPKLKVEDANGNKLLEIKGNFAGWDFKITDTNGKLVGTVNKLDRWQDVFWGGILDKSDKYALRIQGDIDRRLVVASVIAIDNMFHDE